ncbi:MAG: hypothetical protein ACOVNY_06680 [Chitinophagaceae bacterium]
MKKLVVLIIGIISVFQVTQVKSQISVQLNIGLQPDWGPVGYDHVDYYYLPDIEAYYYVPKRQYVYLNGSSWVFATNLPSRYQGYNVYNGYKVVINQPKPYLQFYNHKVKYAKYKGNSGKQGIIKNSNNPKYYVVKGHPKYGKQIEHKTYKSEKHHDNHDNHDGNNGKDHGKGKGKGKG